MVKKVNAIHTNDTLVKKANFNIKTDEIEKAIPDHDIYIIAQEFNKLTLTLFRMGLFEAADG